MKFKVLLILSIVFALTGCSGAGPATALPTVMLDGNGKVSTQAAPHNNGGTATASGIVIPAKQAHMGFTVAGRIKAVNVIEGAQVKAGDVLAELDNAVAQMQVNQADRNLKELTSQAAIAAAGRAVADAQQTLQDAQKKTDSMFFPRASDTLIENTQGAITLAQQQLARARDAYKPLSDLPDGDSRKAAALVAMTNAQINLDRLIANYNWYAGTPSDIDAAKAHADLDIAKAALQESQWYFSTLKGEQIPADATGSKLTGLQQASDDLAAARERFDATRLVAPISGTVVTVNGIAGEIASPGVVFIIISDVSKLQVETTDLSERDVASVRVRQSVTLTVKALGQNVTGHVVLISPVSTTLGGDVVYKTTIDLDTIPTGLRAGMSVDVQFEAN
jgi:HlyD family secretion protein